MTSDVPADESMMHREIAEIPEAVDRLLSRGAPAMRRAADALRARDPQVIVTVARGSSDHAAAYFKYLCELRTGVPVASVGPSVASVYGARLRLSGAACLAISQSGASPDIVGMARMAREEGALSLALTNEPASPLAGASDMTIELCAGAERSVAATKTFVTSLVSAAWLVAEWADDEALRRAVHGLPDALDRAASQDWSALREAGQAGGSMFCLGRGPGFAIAGEAALKVKETCQIHAEAFSSAEVMHGPVSIVDSGFPVVALAVPDAAETVLCEAADTMADKGAQVFATSDRARRATRLPSVPTGHPLTDPISLVVSFYAMVEGLARARGVDPDAPRHLRKVTETI